MGNENGKHAGPITREELYELVWSEPLSRAAKRYGVTDVAVAKWCRKLNVPKPGRGYWQQLKAGQKKRKPPLPQVREGDPTSVPRPRITNASPKGPSEPDPPPPGLEQFKGPIEVPAELEKQHKLVKRTKSAFRGARSDDYGIKSPRPASLKSFIFNILQCA